MTNLQKEKLGKYEPFYGKVKKMTIKKERNIDQDDIFNIIRRGYCRLAYITKQLIKEGVITEKHAEHYLGVSKKLNNNQ